MNKIPTTWGRESPKRITVKRKPRRCPECGSPKVARILYGMPVFRPELEKDLEEGKIVLGGCCVTGEDPTWQCVDCGTSIYTAEE